MDGLFEIVATYYYIYLDIYYGKFIKQYLTHHVLRSVVLIGSR